MRLLFVHQNFPGQYLHLANYYSADSANEVVAITASDNQQPEIVRTIRYPVPGPVTDRRPANLASNFVAHVARGEAVAKAAECLRQEGSCPM
jgi:Glycosyl transferase family 4 group